MSDPRFARLRTDPRFRRPRKNVSKVPVDARFKEVFSSGKKKDTAAGRRVDKYGRPVAKTHERDKLRRFYRLGDEESNLESSKPDYARGGVLMESSDENEDEKEIEEDADDDEDSFVTLGLDRETPITLPHDEEVLDVDLDENTSTFADLDAQAAAYAKAYTESAEPKENVLRTRRLAVVNLDWDHVRAVHLYKIFSSIASSVVSTSERHADDAADQVVRGKVLSVRVYPSDFGKERMAREEKEGPPGDIFKRKDDISEEVNERTIYETGDSDDYDEDALRQYQLQRLRYYYAIITCNTVDAASHIYDELEGTELERSANLFDLSFVPDDMTFDEQCRDEATEEMEALYTNYKGIEFVTDALRHSKVKLTWDEDDPERNRITRRVLSQKELEEADFRAYLASSDAESEDSHSRDGSKLAASRDKLRELLLGGEPQNMPEGWSGEKDDIDMEITFAPGLSGGLDEMGEESTMDKYQRKMKEKRKKRMEKSKNKTSQKETIQSEGWAEDNFFVGRGGSDIDEIAESRSPTDSQGSPHQSGSASRQITSAEELSLLVATDRLDAEPKHFNLKTIIKAEKSKGKRKKSRIHVDDSAQELQEEFSIDVADQRFKAIHEDYAFAIDPSNPHFQKTSSMKTLLAERSKRRKGSNGTEIDGAKNHLEGESQGLHNLVERVKRKAVIMEQGVGKRRKA